MAVPPTLDRRSEAEIVSQLEALAEHFAPPWKPVDGDLGRALIRLFGRMASHLIRQLNKVPAKHQLAFTQLLGAQRIPPRAARAPVTFQIADGVTSAEVPAGTLIGGTSADGTAVTFETEGSLALTSARLAAVFVRDVATRRFADRTKIATGLVPGRFDALGAAEPRVPEDDPDNVAVEHELDIDVDDLLSLEPAEADPGIQTLTVTAEAVGNALPATPIVWWAVSDHARTRLDGLTTNGTQWEQIIDRPRTTAWHGATGRRILRGEVPRGTPALRLSARVVSRVERFPLELGFFNSQRLDLTREVRPFGDRPKVHDTFYIACGEALAAPRTRVTLSFHIERDSSWRGEAPGAPVLEWEIWDGANVTRLGTSWGTRPANATSNVIDSTQAFCRSGHGTIEFPLPNAVPERTFGGVTSRWIRVRIVSGSYGNEIATTNSAIELMNDDPRPPTITSATIGWESTTTVAELSLVRRTGRVERQLVATAANAVEVYRETPEEEYDGDPATSLQLGFDRPPEGNRAMLYFQVLPPLAGDPADYLHDPPPREPLEVTWEYWNGSQWTPVSADDGTRHLSRSGIVSFVPPRDWVALHQFGHELYWFRARATRAAFEPMPQLGRIHTNTIWASHARTIVSEVLGSSNGMPDQTFVLAQTPVLDGARIEVGEASAPDGMNAVVEQLPDRSTIYWVTWHPVADFWASGPSDRHYLLDPETGTITFGNGTRGMIPPTGSVQNVRAHYRAGGGAAGNVPAGVLTQLQTNVAAVDAVANHEPASGGAALEADEALMARASRTLRHRGRAVTAEDFVDLALESSTEVARAVAITPSFSPIDQAARAITSSDALRRDGKILVVVVPTTARPNEAPSVDLLAHVEDYLRARCAPGARVQVVGPSWVPASIRVRAVAPVALADEVERGLRAAIERLFDPVRGGDGSGWELGRRPHASDVIACARAVPGVDHVIEVSIACGAPFDGDPFAELSIHEASLLPRLLVFAHEIEIAMEAA